MGWGARFAGILVAGGVLPAVLAGCGGAGPEPKELVAATAGPTAGSAGTPAAVATPTATATAAADEPEGSAAGPSAAATPTATRESAEAFVRHWIAVANAAFASGDTAEWEALNAPGCASCDKRVDAVRATYGAGGRIEGGRLEVSSLAATPLTEGDRPFVLAKLVAGPERHLGPGGETVSQAAGGPLTLVFYLAWRGDGWRVTEIKLGVPG